MEALTDKKRVVQNIRKEIEAAKGMHIWNDYVNALKLISEVVFTRSSGFVLELIQNAEDAGADLPGPGVFQISYDERRVKITHNGAPFKEPDVNALCGIRSSKKPERGTLGYLGIGFKSVFKVTDCPEIYSGGFHFKYDRNHTDWNDPASTPWHILPIWLDKASEPIDENTTTFIIPLRQGMDRSSLIEEVGRLRTELYLFLRWLRKIEVVDQVSNRMWTLENLGDNEEGITTLKSDGQEQRFKFFRRTVDVPEWVKQDRLTEEYRANVVRREIAIGFALDGDGNLAPKEAGAMYGGVYSFLPLGEAKSGAKFPIQADFLVQPGRDAINCEAKWNQWLVDEICGLCKEAVEYFKDHEKWKYQFLPAFEFAASKGAEAYEKIFGPRLIEPMEEFLEKDDCVPTQGGGWTRPGLAVRLTEAPPASAALVSMGVLVEAELAAVLGGQDGLELAHPDVKDSASKLIRRVNRWDLWKNDSFLEQKGRSPEAATWFRALYLWLLKHPDYEPYFHYKPRQRLKMYHDYQMVLAADGTLHKGGEVSILDLAATDPLIKDLADEIQASKVMLNRDILAGTSSDAEREDLRGFLTGQTGVQILDSKRICTEALLPKILTTSPPPAQPDLLKYTRCCWQLLGDEVGKDLEFWILTKESEVKPAKEVFLPAEFRPEKNWETHREYMLGLSFLSVDYLADVADDELKSWREFFQAGGVKEAPDNGVEEFAMNYTKTWLSKSGYTDIRIVDKRNYGYDIGAKCPAGHQVQVEVKGQSAEAEVELSSNETAAADKYGETFFLSVVWAIPNTPAMYLVQNPAAPGVGKKDKLTIPVSTWKATKRL